jgi:hypothetical protein
LGEGKRDNAMLETARISPPEAAWVPFCCVVRSDGKKAIPIIARLHPLYIPVISGILNDAQAVNPKITYTERSAYLNSFSKC